MTPAPVAPGPATGSGDRLPVIAGDLRAAARRFGTPLHLTDIAALDAAADELRAAFPDPWIRQYSLKANDVAAIVARLAGHGLGANAVSRGRVGDRPAGRGAGGPRLARGDRQDDRRPAGRRDRRRPG